MSEVAKIYVQGRVQGVGYRYATVQTAKNLGLSGWVRNCQDGRVEVEVTGSPAKIEALLAWCGEGPPMARVEKVEVAFRGPSQDPPVAGFEIKR